MKTLTPSVKEPSSPQAGKLHDRILSAARKSGIDSGQFQDALAYPGTELEDGMIVLLVQFAKKVSGIITPVRAQDTGLVPRGWEVKSDNLEGDISLANLDYSSCPVREGETYVNCDTMLERAGNAYGSLGFAAALLKEQEEGKEIFPVESRGKHYFIMPRTVLIADDRYREVAYFDWRGRRWVLRFFWLGSRFSDDSRFVRPRE
ncbi:MAG: hypothetical protein Q8Q23_02605 [bacterium]|nr:hypothetical protein [bacterium]